MEDAATLYFDIAGNPFPRQLDNLLTFANEGHIVFGTDYPFAPLARAARAIIDYKERQYSEEFQNLLFYQNAHDIFRF